MWKNWKEHKYWEYIAVNWYLVHYLTFYCIMVPWEMVPWDTVICWMFHGRWCHETLLYVGCSTGDGAMRHCYMLDVYPSRVHAQFFVRFVLLNFQFSVQCFEGHCLSFIFLPLYYCPSDYPPLVSLIFLYNINMWCTERLVLFTLTGKHWWSKKPV
jgi:hypothetical protein